MLALLIVLPVGLSSYFWMKGKAEDERSSGLAVLHRGAESEKILKAGMIEEPFGWQGVNTYAKEHYGLTDEQADEVSAVARHVRFYIARKVMESMHEVRNPADAQRVWEFKTYDDFPKEIEKVVRDRLIAAVGPEFAKASLPMLPRDHWFLGAGTCDLRILLNPTNDRSYRGEDMITFQFLDKKGEKNGSMSVVASLAREVLRIDLEHANID